MSRADLIAATQKVMRDCQRAHGLTIPGDMHYYRGGEEIEQHVRSCPVCQQAREEIHRDFAAWKAEIEGEA